MPLPFIAPVLEKLKMCKIFGIETPTLTLPLGVEMSQELPQARQILRDKYGIAPQTPIVLFLSRLHYKKRPDLLLQSLNQLASSQNFHLILAGSGEQNYLKELQNLASSLGLGDRVSFPGFVTGYDKQLVLQGSDLFVLPSFSENFGVAVAEAMSHGLPVIVTPGVQIAPEITAARAGLVVPGEAAALTKAIAILLTSPTLRQELGENGKRLSYHRYSWEAISSNLQLVYSALSQKQAIPPIPLL
jgi:glycosyltransferase involved in cell wall biosynthesis